MQEQIDQLNKRIESLEKQLSERGINFEEKIRDAVYFDSDGLKATTETVNVVGGMGGTVTVPITPSYFLKGYYRGKALLFAVYIPS